MATYRFLFEKNEYLWFMLILHVIFIQYLAGQYFSPKHKAFQNHFFATHLKVLQNKKSSLARQYITLI